MRVCFYFRKLQGTPLAAASTLTSTHVPDEVALWWILAGVRLRGKKNPKLLEILKELEKQKKEDSDLPVNSCFQL